MCDDPDVILDVLGMIGGAVMKALDMLEKNGELGLNSSIPNVGLVLGEMRQMVRSWPGDEDVCQLYARTRMCSY